MADATPKPGPTGDYPDGKLGPDDEGELMMGITNDGRLVHVDFGKPVKWFAVPPDHALALAAMLVKHAMAIKERSDGAR